MKPVEPTLEPKWLRCITEQNTHTLHEVTRTTYVGTLVHAM